MAEPTVSAVVPVFNGESFIAEAIDSILRQRPAVCELIVVDDGSTDGTAAVVRRFIDDDAPVRYLHQANAGQAEARNRGAALARGDYLAFLDADDVWTEGKLALQLAAFDADAQLDVVFGHTEQFLDEGAPASAVAMLANKRIMPARLPSAMLIRRAAFERVGPFTSQFAVSEVVDWLARAEEAGLKSRVLDEVVYRRRIHGHNITHRRPQAQQDYLAMVKAALDRRRARQQSSTDGETKLH